jgi:hypothetical protein
MPYHTFQYCLGKYEAENKPTMFEPGMPYYEKETGRLYVCQDVFKSGPCMVRIGGYGKGKIMNPDWFIPAIIKTNEHE